MDSFFQFGRSKRELSNFRFAGALEHKSVYVVEALEPRILLSAAPVGESMEAESVYESSSSEQQQHAALAHAAESVQLTTMRSGLIFIGSKAI